MLNNETVKQAILGTFLGKLANNFRNYYEVLSTFHHHSESLGTLVNDQMATFLVTKLCNSDKVFVDIGSHIGSIISDVLDYDSRVKVIAIEAMPDKVKKLRLKFPSVKIYDCALGESEGEVAFYVNNVLSGYSSLGKSLDKKNHNLSEIKVKLRKLDNIIFSEVIDVMKIDVEGAELGVLRGSKRVIIDHRPIIMFESGPSKNDGLGYKKEDIWYFLNDLDYQLIVPNRMAHNGHSLTLEGFIESHDYPRRTTNYFAIPSERLNSVRDLCRNILKIM